MKFKTFLAAVARYWTTFALVTALVFGVALAWLLLTPAKYVSTIALMVSISGSTTAAAYQNDEVVAGRINSYIPLLTSDVVSQRVIDRLGLNRTAPDLAADVSATRVPPNTSIIDVAVTADSAPQARLLAATYASEFIAYVRALETPTGEDDQKIHVTAVDDASEPRSNTIERGVLAVLAALAAALCGAVAVWIRAVTDPIIRSTDRAAASAVLPVLGSLDIRDGPDTTGDLEDYRRLRARLMSACGSGAGKVLEIAAVSSEVDAAAIAFRLGRAMELAGRRCVVLNVSDSAAETGTADANPESESVVADHGHNDETDSDSATAAATPFETGTQTEPDLDDGLVVPPDHISTRLPDIRSMSAWANEPDLIASTGAWELLEQLSAEYDHVIIAAPPALSNGTASSLGDLAEAVLLVASAETTKRSDLSQAAERLRATGAPLIGVVLAP